MGRGRVNGDPVRSPPPWPGLSPPQAARLPAMMLRISGLSVRPELRGLAAYASGARARKRGLSGSHQQPAGTGQRTGQRTGQWLRKWPGSGPLTPASERKICRRRVVFAGERTRMFSSEPGGTGDPPGAPPGAPPGEPPGEPDRQPRVSVVGIPDPLTWIRCKVITYLTDLYFETDINSVEFDRGVKQYLKAAAAVPNGRHASRGALWAQHGVSCVNVSRRGRVNGGPVRSPPPWPGLSPPQAARIPAMMLRISGLSVRPELRGLAAYASGAKARKRGLSGGHQQPAGTGQRTGQRTGPWLRKWPGSGPLNPASERKLCRRRVVFAGERTRMFSSEPGGTGGPPGALPGEPPGEPDRQPRVSVVGIPDPLTWIRCKVITYLTDLYFETDINSVEFDRGVKQLWASELLTKEVFLLSVGLPIWPECFLITPGAFTH
ncbi:unnamed protein product [Menidia menidia]|uniref:(Atlantic silverside) hypothetical protein n=1 Tax=Menidia menidia TaxID=238744 RepID=A0A8S4BM89_9TELE|nr:unnamed protein product [Menidia menidia]